MGTGFTIEARLIASHTVGLTKAKPVFKRGEWVYAP